MPKTDSVNLERNKVINVEQLIMKFNLFCRTGQLAARAGTPGFRSPEVLMKLPNQTTGKNLLFVVCLFVCLLRLTGLFVWRMRSHLTVYSQPSSFANSSNSLSSSSLFNKYLGAWFIALVTPYCLPCLRAGTLCSAAVCAWGFYLLVFFCLQLWMCGQLGLSCSPFWAADIRFSKQGTTFRLWRKSSQFLAAKKLPRRLI